MKDLHSPEKYKLNHIKEIRITLPMKILHALRFGLLVTEESDPNNFFIFSYRTDIDLEISTSQAGPGGQKITSPIFFFARPLLILDKKTQLQRKRDS